jgi:hypothetical protein
MRCLGIEPAQGARGEVMEGAQGTKGRALSTRSQASGP